MARVLPKPNDVFAIRHDGFVQPVPIQMEPTVSVERRQVEDIVVNSTRERARYRMIESTITRNADDQRASSVFDQPLKRLSRRACTSSSQPA